MVVSLVIYIFKMIKERASKTIKKTIKAFNGPQKIIDEINKPSRKTKVIMETKIDRLTPATFMYVLNIIIY